MHAAAHGHSDPSSLPPTAAARFRRGRDGGGGGGGAHRGGGGGGGGGRGGGGGSAHRGGDAASSEMAAAVAAARAEATAAHEAAAAAAQEHMAKQNAALAAAHDAAIAAEARAAVIGELRHEQGRGRRVALSEGDSWQRQQWVSHGRGATRRRAHLELEIEHEDECVECPERSALNSPSQKKCRMQVAEPRIACGLHVDAIISAAAVRRRSCRNICCRGSSQSNVARRHLS